MILKFRHKLQGGHVHVRVFTGDNPLALGLSGILTFRPTEWDQFKKWHSLAASTVQLTRVDQAGGLTYDIYFVDDSDYPPGGPTAEDLDAVVAQHPKPDLPDDLLLVPLLDHDQCHHDEYWEAEEDKDNE